MNADGRLEPRTDRRRTVARVFQPIRRAPWMRADGFQEVIETLTLGVDRPRLVGIRVDERERKIAVVAVTAERIAHASRQSPQCSATCPTA